MKQTASTFQTCPSPPHKTLPSQLSLRSFQNAALSFSRGAGGMNDEPHYFIFLFIAPTRSRFTDLNESYPSVYAGAEVTRDSFSASTGPKKADIKLYKEQGQAVRFPDTEVLAAIPYKPVPGQERALAKYPTPDSIPYDASSSEEDAPDAARTERRRTKLAKDSAKIIQQPAKSGSRTKPTPLSFCCVAQSSL